MTTTQPAQGAAQRAPRQWRPCIRRRRVFACDLEFQGEENRLGAVARIGGRQIVREVGVRRRVVSQYEI
jgi:hypothetical protein